LYAGDTENAFALFEEGIARGSTSQLNIFALAYIAKGDLRSGMFVLALMSYALNDSIGTSGVLYRALTEPGFDFDREWQKILNTHEAKSGKLFDENHRLNAFTALVFRKYDAMRPSPYISIWWHPNTPDFHASPHRNRLIREMGIYDYWLKAGFPPQCRPIGEDDFECD
jgi:hypothetical protein